MLAYRNNLAGVDPFSRARIAVMSEDARDVRELLDRDGFALVQKLVPDAELAALTDGLNQLESQGDSHPASTRARRGSAFARRNLLEAPAVRSLVASRALRDVVRQILGEGARAVRGILFDKTPEANWLVPWHQDLSIAVRERRGVPGFGPWSIKAGVHHVQPPVGTLERMVAVRVHVDHCPEENGPLRVIPGSHRKLWTPAELERLVDQSRVVTCCAGAGDALLMRPMLVHTSAPARRPAHRRVVHVEFADGDLPGGLEWHAGTSY